MAGKRRAIVPIPRHEPNSPALDAEVFEIERLHAEQYLLKRQPVADNVGLVDTLLACPVKGWFQPIPSNSTDSL